MDFSSPIFSLETENMQKSLLFQEENLLTAEDSSSSLGILPKRQLSVVENEKNISNATVSGNQDGYRKMSDEIVHDIPDKLISKDIFTPENNVCNELKTKSKECDKKKNYVVDKQKLCFSSGNRKDIIESDKKIIDRSDSSLPDQVAQQVTVQCAGFEDIAGLESVKQILRESIIYPSKYPQLFTDGRTPWSRALLYGPSGVGKTALAHATAAEAQLPLYQVSSPDLMNSLVGNTEKLIRRLFSTLGDCPCILFMDEVDCLFRKRGSRDSDHGRRATNEMLIQMSKYEGSPMFLLCATNCPWDIDPAFLRRLQQRIYVLMPDVEARERIILSSIGALGELSAGDEWNHYLRSTEGLSGSDLKGLVRSALMLPLREMRVATHWVQTCGKMVPSSQDNIMAVRCTLDQIPDCQVWCRPINIADLWLALQQLDITVSSESIARFQHFHKGGWLYDEE